VIRDSRLLGWPAGYVTLAARLGVGSSSGKVILSARVCCVLGRVIRSARVAVAVLREAVNWLRVRLMPTLFNNVVGIEYPRKSKCLGCCRAISACTVESSGKLAVPKQVFHHATSFQPLCGYASFGTKSGWFRICSARCLMYSLWLFPRLGRNVGGASFPFLLAGLLTLRCC
jgi:hypothetical protein